MAEEKVKVKLTNLRDEPLRLSEEAERQDVETSSVDRNGQPIVLKNVHVPDKNNVYPVKNEYRNGQVIKVNKLTAEHLIASGQAEYA